MPEDTQETPEVVETPETEAPKEAPTPKLSGRGMAAMQGIAPEAGESEGAAAGGLKLDESQMQPLPKPPDPSTFEYRTGSPHADYQMYKDILQAERQAELGRGAMSGGESGKASIGDAIGAGVQTAYARRETNAGPGEYEKQTDEWMNLKYGPAPYTDPAYPQAEPAGPGAPPPGAPPADDSQVQADQDALLAELDALRQKQQQELEEDLKKFDDRPRPPWAKGAADPVSPG